MDLIFLLAQDASNTAYKTGAVIGAFGAIALLILMPLGFVISLILSIKTKHTGWIISTVVCGVLTLGLGVLFGLKVMQGVQRIADLRGDALETGEPLMMLDGAASILPPSNWRNLNTGNTEAEIQTGNVFREEYLIALIDRREDFAGTLEDHANLTLNSMTESLKDVEVTEPERLTINGLPAVRHEVKGTIDNVNIDYIHTTIEGQHAFYQLLGWTLRSKREEAFPVILRTVDTFKETAPRTEAPASPDDFPPVQE